ncbi:hypothetical protein CEUSTIGMA_g7013.t1 [Chlamydomonas eustigma]|uniref:Uncharacterized protein n=1 Tax=Chlamydomonas eustigma TaxID=1157962 RepID=A0A250X9N7_9CHLO|nr:hypothetical protein CEUSTIGMA_g7013.t1 [Chlamydomonas eustigma]|eukprot:GAX79572.1 hypothetical protein CEUSTIGMA_g7013.t1 [Chlamydomonas eustigma]
MWSTCSLARPPKQHPYENRGCLLNDDVSNLGKVLEATKQTLFSLDTGYVSLNRILCLFEVWKTFEAKSPSGLCVLMLDVAELFNTFDISLANATQPADMERIPREIEENIGSVQLNLRLKDALVTSADHKASNRHGPGKDT